MSSPAPLVWFLLLESATGLPYKETTADYVSLPPDSVLSQFRKAVHLKTSLSSVDAGDLLVYKNNAAFEKRKAQDGKKEEPLEEDSLIDGLGSSKIEALIVVLPSSRNSSRITSEFNLTGKEPTDTIQSLQDAGKSDAPLLFKPTNTFEFLELQYLHTEQEINALEKSEEYKTLVKKNLPWAVPQASEQEKEEWQLLEEKLHDLNGKRQEYVNTILSKYAHSKKKSDKTQKRSKKDIAIQHGRALLSDAARKMWERFRFKCEYENNPSFDELKRASGFKDDDDVRDYFRNKASGQVKEDEIKDCLPENVWIFLIILNQRVNWRLHDRLIANQDGSLRLVLEQDVYQQSADLAENAVHMIYGSEQKVDIIAAASD